MLCLLTESTNYVLLNDTTLEFVSKSQISVVRYAYVTIGCIVFVTSALYAAAYCHDRIAKHSASTLHQRIPMTRQTTTHKKDGIEVSVRKPAKRQFREKYVYRLIPVVWFLSCCYRLYCCLINGSCRTVLQKVIRICLSLSMKYSTHVKTVCYSD